MKASLILIEEDSEFTQPGLGAKSYRVYRVVTAEIKFAETSIYLPHAISDVPEFTTRLASTLRSNGVTEVDLQNGRELNHVELLIQKEYPWEECGMEQFTTVPDLVFRQVSKSLAEFGIVVNPLGEVTGA